MLVTFDASCASETLDFRPRDGALFQIVDEQLVTELEVYVNDLVDLEIAVDDRFRFVRVVLSSPDRDYSWLVTRTFVESTAIEIFEQSVEAADGRMERAMGGILLVHLPSDLVLDADAELPRQLKRA